MIHFVECKPDERLLRVLGATPKDIIHENDKGRVFWQLSKRPKDQLFAMVDEDPASAQPTGLKRLQLADFRYQVRVMSDPLNPHTVVILCPRLEEWIIQAASAAKVSMANFNLTSNAKQLHDQINHRLPNFERLCCKLLEEGSPHLNFLRSHLP